MNLKMPPELWIFLLSPHWEGLGLQARTYVSGFGGTGESNPGLVHSRQVHCRGAILGCLEVERFQKEVDKLWGKGNDTEKSQELGSRGHFGRNFP